MVLCKEYRICMPITVEEYRIGQLYMIARHSYEQSSGGEGVEVVVNEKIHDEVNGEGQYTEKRIHLSSHLPYWIQAMIPKIFYVTEKAWNYYPYTITEYTCSFLPKFSILINTKYENNNGTTENCLGLSPEELESREVDYIDIAYDDIKAHHYKAEEDPTLYKSVKTGRGPLLENWRATHQPIMCCYKVIQAKFEVWGLQTKVEEFIQSEIRNVLLLGHRQAFTWMDEWWDMTLEDVRAYEQDMYTKTNMKINTINEEEQDIEKDSSQKSSRVSTPKSPKISLSPNTTEGRSWFSWS